MVGRLHTIKTHMIVKKDEDEPTHPVGFHDNVPEEKKDEDPENCDSCTI